MSKMKKSEKNHTVFSKYPPGVYLFASSFIHFFASSAASPPILLQKHLYLPHLCPFYFCHGSATLPYWMSESDVKIG